MFWFLNKKTHLQVAFEDGIGLLGKKIISSSTAHSKHHSKHHSKYHTLLAPQLLQNSDLARILPACLMDRKFPENFFSDRQNFL